MSAESSPNSPGSVGPDAAASLMLRIAGRQGPTFSLNASADNTIGRAATAGIVVADRLASRIHASVRLDPAAGQWTLHDLGSRNGTWVDGRQVTTAALADGAEVRIGTTELVFRLRTKEPPREPTDEGTAGAFVRCGPVAQLEGSVLRRASAGATDDARRPLLLYQASIRLLASRSIREVIGTTLELAAEHCGTKGVGWFRVLDGHRLETVCVVPPGSPLVRLLGESTRRLVAGEGNAIWASGPTSAASGKEPGDEHEVVCIPIVDGDRVHAALAALAVKGGMRPADFDFLVALASLAAAAYDGHAGPAVVPMPHHMPPESNSADDLASRQTVDLDPMDLDDDGKTIGFDEIDVASLDPRGTDAPAGVAAQESLRIESFVAETPMLKLDHWQRMLVIEALRRAGGSVPGAAAELGISRSSLHRQLARYGLVKSDPG